MFAFFGRACSFQGPFCEEQSRCGERGGGCGDVNCGKCGLHDIGSEERGKLVAEIDEMLEEIESLEDRKPSPDEDGRRSPSGRRRRLSNGSDASENTQLSFKDWNADEVANAMAALESELKDLEIEVAREDLELQQQAQVPGASTSSVEEVTKLPKSPKFFIRPLREGERQAPSNETMFESDIRMRHINSESPASMYEPPTTSSPHCTALSTLIGQRAEKAAPVRAGPASPISCGASVCVPRVEKDHETKACEEKRREELHHELPQPCPEVKEVPTGILNSKLVNLAIHNNAARNPK